jgi:RimJ/RimL family protein N-acetyltransferase
MGIATIAVSLITSYGIKVLGLNRLYASVFSINPASMKVLEKCGYLREGIARNAVWKNGKPLDEYRYAYAKETVD